MARVTIEQCWWTDPRRSALIRALGDEDLADAGALRAWKLAQEFWKHGKGLVPKQIFESLRTSAELIRTGLAEVRGEYVYVRGSSAYLDWVRQKTEAAKAAGKKSVDARRAKAGTAQPKPRTKTERTSNEPRTESNDAEPSGSSSSSGSGSFSDSNKSPLPPFDEVGLQEVWNENCGKLPKCETLNRDRKRFARVRLSEKPERDYWVRIVRAIAASPFHNGDNDRGWVAGFDYLMRPKTHIQIAERLSAERVQASASKPPEQEAWEREMNQTLAEIRGIA